MDEELERDLEEVRLTGIILWWDGDLDSFVTKYKNRVDALYKLQSVVDPNNVIPESIECEICKRLIYNPLIPNDFNKFDRLLEGTVCENHMISTFNFYILNYGEVDFDRLLRNNLIAKYNGMKICSLCEQKIEKCIEISIAKRRNLINSFDFEFEFVSAIIKARQLHREIFAPTLLELTHLPPSPLIPLGGIQYQECFLDFRSRI